MNGTFWKAITLSPIILTILGAILIGYTDIKSDITALQATVKSIDRQLEYLNRRLNASPNWTSINE